MEGMHGFRRLTSLSFFPWVMDVMHICQPVSQESRGPAYLAGIHHNNCDGCVSMRLFAFRSLEMMPNTCNLKEERVFFAHIIL